MLPVAVVGARVRRGHVGGDHPVGLEEVQVEVLAWVKEHEGHEVLQAL